MQDHETKANGKISGANRGWASFGWGSRADWFVNNASYNFCLYPTNYGSGPSGHIVRAGYSSVWKNAANSNTIKCG